MSQDAGWSSEDDDDDGWGDDENGQDPFMCDVVGDDLIGDGQKVSKNENIENNDAQASVLRGSTSKVLKAEDILSEREDNISRVSMLCNIEKFEAQALLCFCNWSESNTVERFFSERETLYADAQLDFVDAGNDNYVGKNIDGVDEEEHVEVEVYEQVECTDDDDEDVDQVCSSRRQSSRLKAKAAGRGVSSKKTKAKKMKVVVRKVMVTRKKGAIECSVCFDETHTFTVLRPCGHAFCDECWGDHLRVQIENGQSVEIECMHYDCHARVPEHVVRKLVSEQLYAKYSLFSSKQFVESSSNMRWCPRPGCTNAVSDPQSAPSCRVATCSCGYSFCFDCALEAHAPASCGMMKLWRVKCNEDNETYSWIIANTKDCPRCSVPIEKQNGCFMMTCKSCRHQFCWLCLADWSTHPNHFRCATYNETQLSNRPEWRDRNAESDKRKSIGNMLRYYNMYKEHHKASTLEESAERRISKRIETLQDESNDFHLYDTSFVRTGYRVLRELRYVLKHTYVYSYYLDQPELRAPFELFQSRIEMLAESLTKELDRPIGIGSLTPPTAESDSFKSKALSSSSSPMEPTHFDPERVKHFILLSQRQLEAFMNGDHVFAQR
jgi:IBR domain, a half RING-finger domain/IBR domain